MPSHPQGVGVTHHRLDVVAAHHDGDVPRRAHLAQHSEQGDTARRIEEGGWLVEQQDGRLLSQCPSYHDPLTLSVRQFANEVPSQLGGPHRRQGLVDDGLVMGPQPTPDSGMGVTSQRDDIPGGEAGDRDPVRQHRGEGLGDLTARHL